MVCQPVRRYRLCRPRGECRTAANIRDDRLVPKQVEPCVKRWKGLAKLVTCECVLWSCNVKLRTQRPIVLGERTHDSWVVATHAQIRQPGVHQDLTRYAVFMYVPDRGVCCLFARRHVGLLCPGGPMATPSSGLRRQYKCSALLPGGGFLLCGTDVGDMVVFGCVRTLQTMFIDYERLLCSGGIESRL